MFITVGEISIKNIALPIPYSDNNYTAIGMMNYGSGAGYPNRVYKNSKSQIQVIFTVSGNPRKVSVILNGY